MAIRLNYKYGILPGRRDLEPLPVPIIREHMESSWFMMSLPNLPSRTSLTSGPDKYLYF